MKRGAFETGTYRNVFAEAGYDKETIEKRKNEIFHTLFYGAESERIYHPVGDDMAYIEDTGNHDARTEGMSYGMMMCVQMDRKEEFDRLWKWTKTYMYLEEGSVSSTHTVPFSMLILSRRSLFSISNSGCSLIS